jgi:hypothetical protein
MPLLRYREYDGTFGTVPALRWKTLHPRPQRRALFQSRAAFAALPT